MRCRSRDGPVGSHHDDARALKCVISVSSTVEREEALWEVCDREIGAVWLKVREERIIGALGVQVWILGADVNIRRLCA